MSRAAAPIYVRVHDLALDVHKMRTSAVAPDLLRALREEARTVLCEVSLALTFVAGRAAHLDGADRALARLKVLVRLASDVGTLDLAARERLGEQIVAIGRMIGGWQRHSRRPAEAPVSLQGEAPISARGG